MGPEAEWVQLDPDFAADKKAMVAEAWNGAIAALNLAALRDPRNADIQNYIGYAYRRLRQLGLAMQHDQKAYCSIGTTAVPMSTLGGQTIPLSGAVLSTPIAATFQFVSGDCKNAISLLRSSADASPPYPHSSSST